MTADPDVAEGPAGVAVAPGDGRASPPANGAEPGDGAPAPGAAGTERPRRPPLPDVNAGPPPASERDRDIVVSFDSRSVCFAPFGGSIEARLRSNRFYENELLEYIAALNLKGTYVDVGGYVGTHALFLATYCPADVVHTFEPRRRCYDHLVRNIEANGLTGRVRAHRTGLSDRRESVAVTLDGKAERVDCVRLDQVVRGHVSVMKVDVEGMEEKVLRGAGRIIERCRPVIFVEAHGEDELARNLAVVERYGYRVTGRSFNSSPTYELAADDSPMAGRDRLPVAHSLLDPAKWPSVEPGLEAEWLDGGRLRLRSTLTGDARAHLTQQPASLRRAPAQPPIDLPGPARVFLQATGRIDHGVGAAIFVMEYDDEERIGVTRFDFHPRLFNRIDLLPATKHVRVAIRLGGPGVLELDALAFHVLPGTEEGGGSVLDRAAGRVRSLARRIVHRARC